jgi:hypothetical protein
MAAQWDNVYSWSDNFAVIVASLDGQGREITMAFDHHNPFGDQFTAYYWETGTLIPLFGTVYKRDGTILAYLQTAGYPSYFKTNCDLGEAVYMPLLFGL